MTPIEKFRRFAIYGIDFVFKPVDSVVGAVNGNGHSGTLGKKFHGVDIVEIFDKPNEPYNVPARSAAETIK